MTLALAKVCGLTRKEDVALALEAGADYLGFVHYPASPRHCHDLLQLAPLAREKGVLVMVAGDVAEILAQLSASGLQNVQPYLPKVTRAQSVQQLRAAGLNVLLPWPDSEDALAVEADLYIWETPRAITGVHGGSGLAHAGAHPPPDRYLLAGGVDAESLAARAEALPRDARARLAGFDAASRLESAPGQKDPVHLQRFVRNAHAFEL